MHFVLGPLHWFPAASLPFGTCTCVFACDYEPRLITGCTPCTTNKRVCVCSYFFLSLSTVNECGESGFAVRVRGKYRGGAVSLDLMAVSVSIPITKVAILLRHILRRHNRHPWSQLWSSTRRTDF